MRLRIGELAERSGCKAETIRYYEKIGLLAPPPRSAAGYRHYDASHLQRLRFIRRSRELGFSLEEVRGLLSLSEQEGRGCEQALALARGHLESVRAKLAALQRLEAALAALAHGCESNAGAACPLLDRLWAEDVREL